MTAEAPYPGLRPFEPDEVDVFFGREEQIDQLLGRLDRSRLLAVVGLSGCGKSSLVKAGLVPALQTGFLASAGARWRIAEMRPGDQPMRRLAEALLAEGALGPERAGQPGALGFLLATLRRGPLGLAEVVADTPPPEGTRLLLVVDQFEEIFRYVARGDAEEAEAFVALLLATVAQPDSPVYVVLTMRSDFLGDCARFEGLPEALNDSQFLTPRMRREERRAAIEGPAGVFGASIEPVLVNRLLNDMGDDPDQLPLMQHLLMRLWNRCGDGGDGGETRIAAADYEAVGGFEDALSRHADEAFEELDEEGRRIAERLFRALSERGDDQRDVRRPARLGEVAAIAGVEPERVAAVVEVFRRPGRSFLTPPAGVPLEPETVLDVSHESLIRQWRRLRDWVEREALSAAIYRRLAETARLWKLGEAGLWGPPDLDVAISWRDRQRPTPAWAARYGGDPATALEFVEASGEKRRRGEEAEAAALAAVADQRRVRLRNRLLTYGLVLGGALLALAFGQWRRAERQRDMAEEQTLLAQAGELVAEAREVSADQPQLGLLLAAEAQALERDAGVPETGASAALQRALSTSGGRGLASHAGAVVALAVTPDGRWLATGSRDGTARLWDLAAADPGAAPRVLPGHPGGVTALLIGGGGRWLATAGADGGVRQWDLGAADGPAEDPAAAPRELTGMQGQIVALAADPGGRWLAAGGEHGQTVLWELASDRAEAARRFSSHRGTVSALAASPDGRWLVSGGEDHAVVLHDLTAAGAQPIDLGGHRGPVEAAAFTPDGRWVATAARDNTVRLRSVDDPAAAPIVLCGHAGSVVSLAISDDGRWLITGSSDATARSWRLPELLAGAAARRRSRSDTVVLAAEGPGRCDHLLTDEPGGAGVVWDLRELEPPLTAVLRGHMDTVTALALSPVPPDRNLRFLATASLDHTVRVWGLSAANPGQTSVVLRGHDGPVGALAFDRTSPRLFSGSADATARIWDLGFSDDTLYAVALSGAHDAVGAVALTSDGRWLAAGSDDNDVHLWDLEYIEPPLRLEGHHASIHAVAVSPDDRWLASSSLDGTLRLWDLSRLPAAAPGRVLATGLGPSPAVAFDPGGRWLAGAGGDGGLRLWRLDAADPAGAPILLCAHLEPVTGLAFGPDGDRLVSIGGEGTARLWDLAALAPLADAAGGEAPLLAALPAEEAGCRNRLGAGAEAAVQALGDAAVRTLTAAGAAITAAAWVPAMDGRGAGRLATADSTGKVALWPADGGGEPATFEASERGVTRLVASADGRWLAVAGDGAVAHLVDLEPAPPGSRILSLRDHHDKVVALAFGPEGRWLATGSCDDEARLWDLSAADPAAAPGVLYGHRAEITSLKFSPDGSWLVTGSRDHTVRVWSTYLWSLGPDALIDLACRVAGRELTAAEGERFLRGLPVRRACSGRRG